MLKIHTEMCYGKLLKAHLNDILYPVFLTALKVTETETRVIFNLFTWLYNQVQFCGNILLY